MQPLFFETQSSLRTWFDANHIKENELWVGYYKISTGKLSITWPQSVDEAICFGWIDGIRKTLDKQSYTIRFTPRKPRSHWSAVNIAKAEKMIKAGLMKPAGIKAFNLKEEKRSRKASYEQEFVQLSESFENMIKANKAAWDYFQKLPPSVRKTSVHWIMSAKQEETRLRRLGILIHSSEKNQRIPPLQR